MKISRFEKLAYGIGYLGVGMCDSFIVLYLVFFATEVLYIRAALAGIIVLVPQVLDVFTDILVVGLIDKTNTRFGKYRPWILSAIPTAICLILLFSKPSFLTTSTQQALWLAVVYLLTAPVFETIYWCPYLTLQTAITDDAEDRLSLASAFSSFSYIGNFLVAVTCMPIVLGVGSESLGYHDPAGWRICAMIYAAVEIVCAIICFFGVKERVKISAKNERGEDMRLPEKLGCLKGNAAFAKRMLLTLLFYIPFYVYGTLVSYYCIHVLGSEELISPLSAGGIILMVTGAVLTVPLGKRFEKRQIISVCAAVAALSALGMIFVKWIPVLILFLGLKDLASAILVVCLYAYLPGVAEYTRFKKGKDATTLVLGFSSALEKLFVAVGTYGASLILALGGYDATLPEQTERTVSVLRIVPPLLFLIAAVAGLFVNSRFTELDRKKVEEYQRKNQEANNAES